MADALTIAAAGETPDIAKPMRGLGSGIFEIVLSHRGDAYRAIYALKLSDEELWVIHVFQKKSTRGIKTPKHEIDVIRDRVKSLKEQLK